MRKLLGRRLLLNMVAGLALASSAESLFAGKPTPPPPPLPPVRYQIQFFDMPNPAGGSAIYGMNNGGACVGYYEDAAGAKRAFLYDPDLNPANAIDLNSVVDAPDGWTIAVATDINDDGILVGYLEPEGSPWDPEARMGFALDTLSPTPVLQSLPDDAWDYTTPVRINENADIVGVYENADGTTFGTYLFNLAADTEVTVLGIDIVSPWYLDLNNGGQIAGVGADGSAFRWSENAGGETLIPASARPVVYALNDSGTACGSLQAKLSKNRFEQRAMRFASTVELLPSGYVNAGDINSSGDVVLGSVAGSAIYHNSWGAVKIDQLIDTTDPDAALCRSFSLLELNDRVAGPDFGQIAASVVYTNGATGMCLLTPVSISP